MRYAVCRNGSDYYTYYICSTYVLPSSTRCSTGSDRRRWNAASAAAAAAPEEAAVAEAVVAARAMVTVAARAEVAVEAEVAVAVAGAEVAS